MSTFLPFEAEPSEVGEDGLLGLPGRALEVGVLDFLIQMLNTNLSTKRGFLWAIATTASTDT